jgi:hypothetical protein
MPGDTRHSGEVKLSLQYSNALDNLTEYLPGAPMKGYPVVDSEEYVKVKPCSINSIFSFMGGTSAICLATVSLVPNRIVQGVAMTIWGGSAALCRFLISNKRQRE